MTWTLLLCPSVFCLLLTDVKSGSRNYCAITESLQSSIKCVDQGLFYKNFTKVRGCYHQHLSYLNCVCTVYCVGMISKLANFFQKDFFVNIQKKLTLKEVLGCVACIPVELNALPSVVWTWRVLIFLCLQVYYFFYLFFFLALVHGEFWSQKRRGGVHSGSQTELWKKEALKSSCQWLMHGKG